MDCFYFYCITPQLWPNEGIVLRLILTERINSDKG